MAITITDKTKCNGCGACMNGCPRRCISMKSDDMGFWYPIVDSKNCVSCGICENICPVLNQEKAEENRNNESVRAYAGWSKSAERRYHSTSGGIFSELSGVILKEGGAVAGAAYNAQCDVEHIIISDLKGLEKIRQSKYTQSDTNTVYLQVKELLLAGRKVLFCGTPCQTAGLRAFLGRRDYKNLYMIDFICRGVNSPKAYRAWLNELEEKFESKAVRVWFKYKINGWKKSPQCTRIDFENGKNCVQNAYKNTYMRGYLGPNLYIRPSCGACPFKGDKRFSDITLADFWGIADELDDDGGTSLVLINSEKGRALFEQIKTDIFYQERNFQELLKGNSCFHSSVKINPASEEFLSNLDSVPFSRMIDRYARISIYGKVKYLLKEMMKNFFSQNNGS